jgi:hypothetical protein
MSFPASPYVNVAQARTVLTELQFRLAPLALTPTASQDANGLPVITVAPSSGAAWVTGQQYAVIRFNLVPTIQVDALGLTQTVYTPQMIQLCVEGNTAGTGSPEPATSDFTSVLSWKLDQTLQVCLGRVGALVNIYNSGHGVQPAVAGMIAANLVSSFDDLINPLTSSR